MGAEGAARPAGFGTTLLIGVLVLILLAGIIVGFVPCVTCPKCKGRIRTAEVVFLQWHWEPECTLCHEGKKVTPLRKWMYRPEQAR